MISWASRQRFRHWQSLGCQRLLALAVREAKLREIRDQGQEMQRRFTAFNPTHVQFHSTASSNQGFCIKSSPRDVPCGQVLSVLTGK